MPNLKIRCRVCGKPVIYSGRGRHLLYCSARCGQVANGMVLPRPGDFEFADDDEPEIGEDAKAARLRKANQKFLVLLHKEALAAIREGIAT